MKETSNSVIFTCSLYQKAYTAQMANSEIIMMQPKKMSTRLIFLLTFIPFINRPPPVHLDNKRLNDSKV